MGKKALVQALGALCVLIWAWGAPARGANEVFDARGFNANRDYFSGLPQEHIDPMTGNLLLTFTDLVLPGNAGFELRIQRTYNSKIYQDYVTSGDTLDEDSWAGVGWTLHFGRILNPSAGVPGPVEMPDGSRHKLYNHIDGSGRFISRDFWVYERGGNPPVLRLPNGIVYTFGRNITINNQSYLYVTRIQDPFGNRIDVTYMTGAGVPLDGIQAVTQVLGGQTRTVTFTHEPTFRGLSSMTFQGRTWTYGHSGTNAVGFSLLTAANPPVGAGWQYGYQTSFPPRNELTSITTPSGGLIQYAYSDVNFQIGSPVTTRSRAVTRRTVSGRDLTPGTWSYAYAQGPSRNQSIITSPCGTTTHTFAGVGNHTTIGNAWRVGLQVRQVTSEGGTVLEAVDFEWQPSSPISHDNELIGFNSDVDIHVPLVRQRIVTRGPRTYRTTNTYGAANFNDYGRPNRIDEAGELSRTTTRAFQYGFTPYIVDRIASETLSVAGDALPYTKSYSYNLATGFRTSETVYGLTHTFTPDAGGNVASITDPLNHTWSYTYSWGRVSRIDSPEHRAQITRVISPESLVVSETRRGATTFFTYDARFRPTRVTHPLGDAGQDPTITEYDNSGFSESVVVRRGPSYTQTNLDGMGRPSSTANSVSIRTDTDYDACGRRTYQSYPFTTENIGTRSTYDALDRPTVVRHPDSSGVTYAYDGIDVVITNERNIPTRQDWSAFGDPDEARLVGLTDGSGRHWSYAYTGLGNLSRVFAPEPSANRSWIYNGRNQLESETHPESGTVRYTYDTAGNVQTRRDAFGTTTFTYDANDRVRGIDRPGLSDETNIHYDASDNRTLLAHGATSSTFTYDAANRLVTRADLIFGRNFSTTYFYNRRDDLVRISYPSTQQVTYCVDSEGRVTAVDDTSDPCRSSRFAGPITYHPSGQPASIRFGNGRVQQFTYDNRYWPDLVNVQGHLSLDYEHDPVGNVRAIGDGRAGMRQTFTYDNLDRLASANGPWGAGLFTHDSRGNRTHQSVGGESTSYAYSSERLASSSGSQADSFTYDGNGNLTSHAGGQRSYTYTPMNLVAAATVNGVTTGYRYDGDGLRKLKNGAATTQRYFIHGPGGQLLSEFEERCGGVLPVRDYLYAGTRLIASVRPSSTVSVSLVTPSSSVGEAGGRAAVAVRMTTSNGQPLTCPVSVNFATADGSAKAPGDYSAQSGTLTFAAGAASGSTQEVAVPIVSDSLDEDDESFSVVLSGVNGGAIAGPASHTVTIVDDDAAALPRLSVSDCSVAEGNSGSTPCAFIVSLSAASNSAVTVSYATADGTAAAGQDYVARSGVMTLEPGTTRIELPVEVVGELAHEPDETFSLELSAPSGATLGDGQGLGTIVNDDVAGPPSLSISDVTVTDYRAGTLAYFTVSLSAPSTATVSVSYSTADETAHADQDYFAVSGTLHFPAGQTRLPIAVPIPADARSEGPRTFTVDLAAPSQATLADAQGRGTIVDREIPPRCASPLEPASDGTPSPVDLLLSELSPGNHVELYNPTSQPVSLGRVSHQLTAASATVALNSLAPDTVVPARGYARLPWPAGFTGSASSGEVVLFRDGENFEDPARIVDFTCWGTSPSPSRKAQAESAGKWTGACATPLAAGALHRRAGTPGTRAGNYDVTAPSSPMSCAALFTVTKTADTNDGACDGDCSLREAIVAANAASGPDTVLLPRGTYALTLDGAGEDASARGDLDVTGDLELSGHGARSTLIDGNARDRVFHITPGASLRASGVTLRNGDSSGAPGGGLLNQGRLSLHNAGVTGNRGGLGGGIAATGNSSLTLIHVTLSGNVASNDGGAVATACTSCSVLLDNTTLSGNRAAGSGGAIFRGAGASTTLLGVTATGNIADDDANGVGSGGAYAGSGTGGLLLGNSILAGNGRPGAEAPDCDGSGGGLTSQGFNLIGNGTGCSFPASSNDLVGTSTAPIDPLLGPLADNRGPSPTHALFPGSPAIDTASPLTPGSGEFACAARDQRSYRRPWDGNGDAVSRCDRGALEVCTPVFGDVPSDSIFKRFIEEIYCRGVTAGCSSEPLGYCPAAPVTRAQMAIFLVRGAGENPSGALTHAYFDDVAADVYAPFINRMYELGMTAGCATRQYCPDASVLRKQMAIFLVRAIDEQPSTVAFNAYFDDVPNDVYAPFINRLYELGITAGCGPRQFCPENPVLRQEMAVFLVRSFFDK